MAKYESKCRQKKIKKKSLFFKNPLDIPPPYDIIRHHFLRRTFMKKFAKLVAVFAALMLAWACFVACSNGDDDNGSDDASVKALQGLWIEEGYDEGVYIVSNTLYDVLVKDGKYYYDKDDSSKFSVSGNKITTYYHDDEGEADFEINGDTLILKILYVSEGEEELEKFTYKRITGNPIPLSSEDFNKLDDSLFAD